MQTTLSEEKKMEENVELRFRELEKRIEELENQCQSLTKKTDINKISEDLAEVAISRGL